ISNNGCPVQSQTLASMLAQSSKAAPRQDGLAIRSRDPRRDAVVLENKLHQPLLPPQSAQP
ncbi:MAG: hypothetical protein ACK4NN_17645, partial [Rheinheimera sp.]